MASLFLTWNEVKGEQLPHYCVSCAAPATEWADWRLCNSRHLVFSIQYTYVDVVLPVCPEHRRLRSFLFPRVGAKKIYDDGIELSRLSPGFVEAVWDYREDQEQRERQRPARESHFLNATYADYEEDGYEEDFYEPRPLPRRAAHPRDSHSSSLTLGKAILIAIAILFLAPFVLVALFVVLGLLMSFAI